MLGARRMSDPNFTGGGMQGAMWSPQDLVGTVLADRYQVQKVIGDGGMGSVYEAQHVTLRKRVALKVLHPELCRDQTHVDRFLQEARAASMIEHDNIVDIVDFGPVPGGSVFFAMEFLEGDDLAGVLRRDGRMPWPRVKDIMTQVVRALKAAHGKGIIHRDLKPANCFVVIKHGREHIKLLDFGIAKVTDQENDKGLTRTGAVFGTAKYMAPEQACGEAADQRTDVYAAAVVMYELLTGHVPYDGDNFMRVLSRHLTEPLTLPSTMAPDARIPTTVESIVVKALSKKREDRYQSMMEFEEALGAIGPDGSLRAELAYQGPPQMAQAPGYPPHAGYPEDAPRGSTVWMGQGAQRAPSQPESHQGFGTMLLDTGPPGGGREIPKGRTEFADANALGPAGTFLMDPLGQPRGNDPITGHPPGSFSPGPAMAAPPLGMRPAAKSEPPPGTTPPSPETRPPTQAPDVTHSPDYTEFGERRGKAGFIALVVGGAVAAIGGGGLVAFLLLDDPKASEQPSTEAALVEREHPEVPEPRLEPKPEPKLEPTEPKIPSDDGAEPEPEPEPEPETKVAQPKTPQPKTPQPKQPNTPTPKLSDVRSSKDVKRGFAKALKAAKECGQRLGALPGQVVTVDVGIGSAGNVLSAFGKGPSRNSPLGKCVAGAIKDRARFIKATSPLQTVTYDVKM
jgi:serine/threonine protein kinase